MKKNKNLYLINEVRHGKYICDKGEDIWNWSSPAGILRKQRRIGLFNTFIGEGKKVLEVGCGTGLFTQGIANSNNQVVALDISSELVEKAKKRTSENKIKYIIGDACNTGFSDKSFDYIIGSSVLHHLDLDKALLEFRRLLKPRGGIIFTEPNMLNPQIAIQKNIPFIKHFAGDSPDETAFVRWMLSHKLKKYGFRQIEIIPFDFLHPLTPVKLITMVEKMGKRLEKIPLLKEVSGSLIIKAYK